MLDTNDAPKALTTPDVQYLLDSVRELIGAVQAVEAEKPQAQLADAVACLVKAIAARLG